MALRDYMIQLRKLKPNLWIRRLPGYRALSMALDFPIRCSFPEINHPVYVSLTKNMTFLLTGGRAGEEAERRNVSDLIGRMTHPIVFFDVGANVGLYGFLALATSCVETCHFFEADKDNANLLRKTVDGNHIEAATVHEFALSDHTGTVSFFPDVYSGATGTITRGEDEKVFIERHYNARTVKPTEIPCTTLDAFISTHDSPDFVKIDVEGAEVQVLSGAQHMLAKARPVIMIEVSPSTANQVAELFANHNYCLVDAESMERITRPVFNTFAIPSELTDDLLSEYPNAES